jgi:hypothetical protein
MVTVRKRASLAIVTFLVVSAFSAAQADEGREPVKRYRVVFNCDGHAVCKDAHGDLNQWIENLFGPLEKSHVDALFWCDGAGGNTANYESEVLELTGQRIGKPRPWIAKLMREGHDPPKVVVREAKRRGLDVFYSFRINDIHDAFTPDELATFKVEHPEWLIGEREYGDVTSFRTALNFAVPEVRELKFRVIEEMFRRYDFDGLEIDFMRSPPYFLPGREPENAHLLTKMLRRIRDHLDQRSRERGRAIRLAVRVDESLQACRLDGFDVPAWIEQQLIDYLILGSGVIDIEVEEFKTLAEPGAVLVYPCLYGWPSKYSPIPAELAAGLALNYWHQGADGIYLCNWFPHAYNNSETTGPYMAGLLRQLGDPGTLRARQTRLMFAGDRGRPHKEYPHNWMHCVLPVELPSEESFGVPIRVGEDLRNRSAVPSLTLRLAVDNLQKDDVVAITLNGQRVKEAHQSGPGVLTAPVDPHQLRLGPNEVTLRLAELSPSSAAPRTVTALELDVVLPKQAGDTATPNVAVVVGSKVDKLERYAADELCGYLNKLYGIKTQPRTEVPESAETMFLLGSPQTNPAVAKALGEDGWPKLSDQGIVVKRAQLDDQQAIVVDGGPRQQAIDRRSAAWRNGGDNRPRLYRNVPGDRLYPHGHA